MAKMKAVAIRMPDQWKDVAEALIPHVQAHSAVAGVRHASRSTVYRLALKKGLESMVHAARADGRQIDLPGGPGRGWKAQTAPRS